MIINIVSGMGRSFCKNKVHVLKIVLFLGFYGRPWTGDQRKRLFKWMKKMDMNTYLYAPKDDSKHRMYWRDLYSVEEAGKLETLMQLGFLHCNTCL